MSCFQALPTYWIVTGETVDHVVYTPRVFEQIQSMGRSSSYEYSLGSLFQRTYRLERGHELQNFYPTQMLHCVAGHAVILDLPGDAQEVTARLDGSVKDTAGIFASLLTEHGDLNNLDKSAENNWTHFFLAANRRVLTSLNQGANAVFYFNGFDDYEECARRLTFCGLFQSAEQV
jgi:hypothetical protein